MGLFHILFTYNKTKNYTNFIMCHIVSLTIHYIVSLLIKEKSVINLNLNLNQKKSFLPVPSHYNNSITRGGCYISFLHRHPHHRRICCDFEQTPPCKKQTHTHYIEYKEDWEQTKKDERIYIKRSSDCLHCPNKSNSTEATKKFIVIILNLFKNEYFLPCPIGSSYSKRERVPLGLSARFLRSSKSFSMA